MASFIELNEVDWGEVHPIYINVDLIVEVFPFQATHPVLNEKKIGQAEVNAKVGMLSMDGENNPLVYQVTETYEEVKEKIDGAVYRTAECRNPASH